MSQDDILAKLKKDVRSLLISSKIGLHPDRLRRDYAEMLGHPMPLNVLGFGNIVDMVKEMPDVVSIYYGEDGSPYLKAVSDESTRRIEELVAKQRMSKTDIKVKKRGCSSFSPRYRQPLVFLPRRGCAPPPLPAQLRAQLRFLLSQGELRLSDLESSYMRCFGQPLRFHNYGFYSIGEMLVAAGDLILIQQGRFGSVLTLREQMLPMPLQRPTSSQRRTGLIKPNKPVSTVPDIKVTVPTKPPVSVKQSPLNHRSASSSKPEMEARNRDTKPVPRQEGQVFQEHVIKLEEELRQRILENGVAGTVSQELKDKLRKVVGGQATGGLSVHDLPAEYKRLFGEDLPFLQSGFVSVTELVGALSDTFHLKPAEDDSGHHWTVMEVEDPDDTQSDSKEIQSLSDRLQSPVKSYYFPSGESPWESNLKGDGDDFKDEENYEKEELEPSNISKTKELTSEMCPAIQVQCQSVIPLDALLSQRIKPPTRHSARELVSVFVEQVESPGHFYVRFSESEEAHAMEGMMIEMRRCYTSPKVSERYRLPEQYVRRGQVCCVSPRAMWFYRVVIHKVLSPTQVEVYYVDFGDITVVESATLKFLKSSYSVLPAQAVPSSLAGIKPTSDSWTAEATDSFRNLCSDRTLVGALDCYTGDVLQLFLCDTHTDQDVYIHTVLLSQGHGTACSPAASAAFCVQVTPVSFYLGDGLFQLPQVDEKLILSSKAADTLEQSKVATLKIEEDELPALELIGENVVIPDVQGMEANPSSPLTNDHTISCSEQEVTLTWDLPPINPTSSASTPGAPQDLIDTRTTPAHCKAGAKTQATTPTVTTSGTSSCCPPEEVQQLQKVTAPSSVGPPSILRTLSLHTPLLGQIQDLTQGAPMSPFILRNSGILFPLFGARRAVSPSSTSTQLLHRCKSNPQER
ncbi:tudor domain-containing protein 5 isoform 2-T2 [Odontesthes bonariensis]